MRVVAVFVDRLSGATPVPERPGLVAALAALSSHGAGILVASSRCRLARSPAVADAAETAAVVAGGVVRTADGASDGDRDETAGLISRGMRDLFAAVERAEIRRRTRAALAAKRARGERVGAVPYGWRVADDGRTSKVSGKPAGLEPVPEEQAVVAAVRELAASGLGSYAIASELGRRGVVTRSGRPFRQSQVDRVLGLLRRPA